MYGVLGPEASRRARGLAVWATLRAYGRRGYREMVERHLELAQRVARDRRGSRPRASRGGPPQHRVLPCAPARYRRRGTTQPPEPRLGTALLEDGRVYVGTTRYGGKVAFRPAIVNWRTTEADVDLIVEVVRELAARFTQ